METPGYIALSRQDVLRRQMDVVANNLANMTTPAYRARSLMFTEYLAKTSGPGNPGATSISLVQDVASVPDLSAGPLSATGNPLDLAIEGAGYFVVETDDGPRYTRHGTFQLDAESRIVTAGGLSVLSENDQPLVLPNGAQSVEIARDGTISSRDPANAGQDLIVGRLRLVAFENEYQLVNEAGGLLRAPDTAEPQPADEAEVVQGMIEQSNVKGVVEMTKLIQTVRSYGFASSLSDGEHERQRRAIQLLGSSASQA